MTVGESSAGDDVPAGSSNRLLIVNADDYGMTSGISNGIIAAFERGVVTSTSALTVAAAFDRHAQQLVDSGIPTGAHLAAVGEDRPLLSAREIPTLVDRDGRFPLRWREFVQRAATGRVDPSDLTREFRAQLTRLRDLGVNETHLDSHQNIHLWPSVARDVVDLAAEKSRLDKAMAAAIKERDALAGRLSNPGFTDKAKPEAVEKAREDHAARSAEAERLAAALSRLG